MFSSLLLWSFNLFVFQTGKKIDTKSVYFVHWIEKVNEIKFTELNCEKSIIAIHFATFGPLRESIRILFYIANQFRYVSDLVIS